MEIHFFCCSDVIRNIYNKYNVFISPKFCIFFSKNLESLFINETGLKPSTKVTLGGFKQNNDLPMYEPGLISKLHLVLWIMPEFYDNISFCWKSKSGSIVSTFEEDFDENDLECWIDGLKPALYWKEVSTKIKEHPFQIKNLPYKLKVFGFGMNTNLTIDLNNNLNVNEIINKLYDCIEQHNLKSEMAERNYGIVHNYLATIKNNGIDFRIDVGSAGIVFIKKLLKILAKFSNVNAVIIDI